MSRKSPTQDLILRRLVRGGKYRLAEIADLIGKDHSATNSSLGMMIKKNQIRRSGERQETLYWKL